MLEKILPITAIVAATAFAGSKPYSGAELYSRDTWMYGKFEARMCMGAASGTVSSMFLYHNDSYLGGNEPWVEVDIEVLGKDPNKFQSNIISGFGPGDGMPDRKAYSEQLHDMSPAVNQAYHTYAIEWTPDYVSWQIDGKEVRRTRAGELNKDGRDQVADLRQREQGLRFNLWASEDPGWTGPWNEANLPVYQYINWVKIYEYKPGQGDNGTDFKLSWQDDFDIFDSGFWSAGDWTFDGNRVDLTDQNVVVKDGTLILSLTKKGAEGFHGTVPADTEQPVVTPENPTNPTEQPSGPNVDPSVNPENPNGIAKARGARVNNASKASYNARGEKLGKQNTPHGGFFKQFVK